VARARRSVAGSPASPCGSRAARAVDPWPSSSSRSKAYRNISAGRSRYRSRANTASPFSSQQTASPSIRHERILSPAAVSTMVGEARRPVMPVPGQEPDAGHVAAHHHAVAVVLDLVNPPAADRRALGGGGKGRRDEGECGAQEHGWSGSPPQRNHRGAFAHADQGRNVVAHALESIAAAGPSVVLVVPRDQVG